MIKKLSNGTFIQIDILEKGDYFGHMNILNYDSQVEDNNIYVYSLLPSECMKIHENDILSLPKKLLTKLKEHLPPYPDEKELLEEFNDHLKDHMQKKEIVS